MPKLNQNIIISRMGSRGTVQVGVGVNDRNKVVKTTSSGLIDPSLLPESEMQWERTFNIQTTELLPLYPGHGLVVPGTYDNLSSAIIIDSIENDLPIKKITGPGAIILLTSFCFDVNNIKLKNIDPIIINIGTDGGANEAVLNSHLAKNGVQFATLDITTINNGSYQAYPFIWDVTYPDFNVGDYLNVYMRFSVDPGISIWIKDVKASFEVDN